MSQEKNSTPPLLLVCVALSAIATVVAAVMLVMNMNSGKEIIKEAILAGVFAVCTIGSILMCKKAKTLPSRSELVFDDDED